MNFSEEEIRKNLITRLKQAEENYMKSNENSGTINRYIFMYLPVFEIVCDELRKYVEQLHDDSKHHTFILNLLADIANKLRSLKSTKSDHLKPVIKILVIKISKSKLKLSIDRSKEVINYFQRKNIFSSEYCNELLNDIAINATNSATDIANSGNTFLELTNEYLRLRKARIDLPDDPSHLPGHLQLASQEIALHEKFSEFHSQQNLIISELLSDIRKQLEKYEPPVQKKPANLALLFADDD